MVMPITVSLLGASLIHALAVTSVEAAHTSESARGQSIDLNPYPGRARLQFQKSSFFGSKSTFKVLVVSDTHLLDNQLAPGNESQVNAASAKVVRSLLTAEKPNFVMHNGDIVSGEDANKTQDVVDAVRQIFAPVVKAGVPFASSKGNHDNDKYSTHASITEIENSFSPKLSYSRKAPSGVGGGAVGSDNYWIPVYGSGLIEAINPWAKPKLLIWSFDSRSGKQTLEKGGAGNPNWVDETVGPWIERETQRMSKVWGGVPPSLLFTHIPIHAHYITQNDSPYAAEIGGVTNEVPSNFTSKKLRYEGINDDKPLSSQAQEGDETYAGQDLVFIKALIKGLAGKSRIYSITSGHDHGNDWCAPSDLRTVADQVVPVCFAKHTGYGGYDYIEKWGHGGRVYNFDSDSLEAGVQTYIRFEGGQKRYEARLDNDWAQQRSA